MPEPESFNVVDEKNIISVNAIFMLSFVFVFFRYK